MYTLGCSARIRERLGVRASEKRGAATTRLGDWYAHTLAETDTVLAVSLETLLPVVTTLAPEAGLLPRLAHAAGEVLHALGVPADAAAAELAEMETWSCGKTTRRWVNNAMTDLEWLLEARLTGERSTPLELSLWLAETPCALLGWKSPDEATRAVFGLSPLRHRFELPASRGTAAPPVEPPGRAAPPVWSPALAIGVEPVDRQHQGLFVAFAALGDGRLAGRSAGEAARMLDFLARYVVEHFATEERLMIESQYPGFAAHKAEHDALVAELKTLREQWRTDGPSDTLATALSGRIRSWLSFHIGGSDRAMGQHLQGSAG